MPSDIKARRVAELNMRLFETTRPMLAYYGVSEVCSERTSYVLAFNRDHAMASVLGTYYFKVKGFHGNGTEGAHLRRQIGEKRKDDLPSYLLSTNTEPDFTEYRLGHSFSREEEAVRIFPVHGRLSQQRITHQPQANRLVETHTSRHPESISSTIWRDGESYRAFFDYIPPLMKEAITISVPPGAGYRSLAKAKKEIDTYAELNAARFVAASYKNKAWRAVASGNGNLEHIRPFSHVASACVKEKDGTFYAGYRIEEGAYGFEKSNDLAYAKRLAVGYAAYKTERELALTW